MNNQRQNLPRNLRSTRRQLVYEIMVETKLAKIKGKLQEFKFKVILWYVVDKKLSQYCYNFHYIQILK
jgi:hypothetical protein